MKSSGRGGFSLIEVLVATSILAIGLLAVFSALSPSIAIYSASKRLQQLHWIMALAELKHPLVSYGELEDLVVEEDSELAIDGETLGEGCVFTRTIDEKTIEDGEIDDGIYVIRTSVGWGENGEREELTRLLWDKDAGGYEP